MPTFVHAPAQGRVGDVIIVYIDLETSGLHVLEVAATAERSNAQFSTTACPIEIPAGPGVHGISGEELLASALFDFADQYFGLRFDFPMLVSEALRHS